MTETQKIEILGVVDLEVRAGFLDSHEIIESIVEQYSETHTIDSRWLADECHRRLREHVAQSTTWVRPGDFEKLADAFDILIKEDIVCLHNAGYTRQDAESDCVEAMEELKEIGFSPFGFCYYHKQDLERAVDSKSRSLMLGFGSATDDESRAEQIAARIVEVLSYFGLNAKWPGSVNERIEIIDLNWRKAYDGKDWSLGHVIDVLRR